MGKVPSAVDSGDVRQALERSSGVSKEQTEAVMETWYGRGTDEQRDIADKFVGSGELRSTLSHHGRGMSDKEVNTLVDSISRRISTQSKRARKSAEKLGPVTVPGDNEKERTDSVVIEILRKDKFKINAWDGGDRQREYVILKNKNNKWQVLIHDKYGGLDGGSDELNDPSQAWDFVHDDLFNFSGGDMMITDDEIKDIIEKNKLRGKNKPKLSTEEDVEYYRDLRFEKENELEDETGDEPEYEDVVEGLREDGLTEHEIDMAFSTKKKKSPSKKGGGKRSKAHSKTSGWSKLKEELPSSSAVKARIRDGGHSEAYTKVLKSLQKYWEKRGR